MAKIKIRHLIKRASVYYWQPSSRLRTEGWNSMKLGCDLQTAIAMAEKQNELLDNWRAGNVELADKSNPRSPRTIKNLIKEYTISTEFKGLAKKTQDDYISKLKVIEKWAAEVPVCEITRTAVRDLYKKLNETKSIRNSGAIITTLRLLMTWAIDDGHWGIELNPASKPKTAKAKPRSEMWSHEEQDFMVKTADEMGFPSIGSAIIFAACLGQRESDLLALDFNTNYLPKEKAFRLKQQKTKTWIQVKAHSDLLARMQNIEMLPGKTILRAEFNNEKIKQHYFTHKFAEIRAEAAKTMPGVAKLLFMDFRRTAVVRLAEADCNEAEIAAVTGHKIDTCRNILETYLPRTSKMAENAINKLEKAG